jgi:hypothetical protein
MMNITATTLEDYLVSEGVIIYKVVGKSMEPMIRQNRDLVTIIKREPDVKCSENDVVLFKKNGHLVLHRIVSVLPNNRYNILGDNCAKIEKNIKEEDIIGIMTAFYRDGVHYDMSNSVYINYVNRLRKNEMMRVRRKRRYDMIVHSFYFFPDCILEYIKIIARKITNCQLKFE